MASGEQSQMGEWTTSERRTKIYTYGDHAEANTIKGQELARQGESCDSRPVHSRYRGMHL